MTADQSERRLRTLERILKIEVIGVTLALNEAAQLVAEALGADKVDVFLLDPASATLIALGASGTPMAQKERSIGMDRLPLANRGRAAEVFQTRTPYWTGRADQDPAELVGLTEGLGIRSSLIVPLEVAGECRGVLLASSATPDFFSERDLSFFEAVARWVGILTHHAELIEQVAKAAVEQGRQLAVDDLLGMLTPRQREIALLVAAGLTNGEIAGKLQVHKGTVANHVEHILARLGLKRRTQLVAWITAQGFPLPPLDPSESAKIEP